jgi:hypothetical protein
VTGPANTSADVVPAGFTVRGYCGVVAIGALMFDTTGAAVAWRIAGGDWKYDAKVARQAAASYPPAATPAWADKPTEWVWERSA